MFSLTLASDVICGLLGATSDFGSDRRSCVSLGMVSWRLPARLGLGLRVPSLLWVLETMPGCQEQDRDFCSLFFFFF